jgi:hypothetical protein
MGTTTTINAGEYINISMSCSKPNVAGNTAWHLNASNGQGTTTIGYGGTQSSGGLNPNTTLGMFGTFYATTTKPATFLWMLNDDSQIITADICQGANSAFQFTLQRVKPTQ